jgi:hypothetical protein
MNAIAGLAGLFVLGCGLYLEFGGVDSESKLLEFLKLNDIDAIFNVVVRFPIWIMVLGTAVFLLALVSFFCTGSKCSKCFYVFYSSALLVCAIVIFFVCVVLRIAANTVEESDYQQITILGFNLNEKISVLWMKGVVDDTESICELQEVVQCSGFYDSQCKVPPTNYSQSEVLSSCPAQYTIFGYTGQLTDPSTVTNSTLAPINDQAGWNVAECLANETRYLDFGCLRTLAEILYQVGKVLFIPGLVIGSYILVLSLLASYLQCCTC